MRKRFILLIITLLTSLSAFLPSETQACTGKSLGDRVRLTANQQFVLVDFDLTTTEGKNTALRNTYKQSGLYKNDGSITPLWTTEYGLISYVASDGRHAIGFGRFDTHDLVFYENAKEIKRYSPDDLGAKFDKNALWCMKQPYYEVKFDDTSNRLSVLTNNGDKYGFDLDGDLIEGTLPFNFWKLFWYIVAGLIVVASVNWAVGKLRELRLRR